MRSRLQPYTIEAATLCYRGCNPMRYRWALSRRGVPLLLLVDGLERLVPPLDANEDNAVGGLLATH